MVNGKFQALRCNDSLLMSQKWNKAYLIFRFICTHQWRSCEEVAEWVHEDASGTSVAGWTEWSECFAQREETKVNCCLQNASWCVPLSA